MIKRRFTLLAFFLGLYGIAASRHRAISLAILHGEHEGSHAIVDSFAEIECVASIDEYLDTRHFANATEHAHAMKIFFDPMGPDIHTLTAFLLNVTSKFKANTYNISRLVHHCNDVGLPIVVVALVRGNVLKYTLNNKHPLFFLYRADRMRFSLSLASSVLDEIKDPQFKKGFVAPRRNYSTELIAQKSAAVSNSWKARAKVVQTAIDAGYSCSHLKLLGYEEYQKNNSAFASQLYKTVLELAGIHVPQVMRASSPILQRAIVVAKVHSDDISAFVENAEEVERYFREHEDLSFSEVLDSNVNGCTFDQLKLIVKPADRI